MKKIILALVFSFSLLIPFAVPLHYVEASPSISYDPARGDPTAQGYTADGGQNRVANGSWLNIYDDSESDHLYFSRVERGLANRNITVACMLVVHPLDNVQNEDTGVALELDEGPGGRVLRIVVFQYYTGVGIVLRVGIQLSGGGYGAVLEYEPTIVFGREGDNAFLEVRGVRKTVAWSELPVSTQSQPRFAFGSFSNGRKMQASFSRIVEGGVPVRWLDPSIHPEEQGFSCVGSGGGAYPGEYYLTLKDMSTSDYFYCRKVVPDIPNREIALLVTMQITHYRISNSQTGVGIVLDEGPGGHRIMVHFIERYQARYIVLGKYVDGTFFFSEGFPLSWVGEVTFMLRRDASGNAFLSIPGMFREDMVENTELRGSFSTEPGFEFGSFQEPPESTSLWGRIEEIRPPISYPMNINVTQMEVFTQGAKKVQVQGDFSLDSASPGIDPAADGVALRLKLQGGNQFYPAPASDFMPVTMEETLTGWTISESEKKRTGIQDFEVLKTADPRKFTFKLVDTKTGITAQDYSNITVSLVIGNNEGEVNLTLTGSKGKYKYPW